MRGGTHHTHPKEGWRGKKTLESIRPICLMNTAAKIVTSVWAKRLSKSLRDNVLYWKTNGKINNDL